MQSRKSWLASLLIAAVVLTACRTPRPTPTSSPPPTIKPADPTPTLPPSTPSPAPPTATPLPTWPDHWEPTGGPEGGLIAAIVIDPTELNTLYAAGAGGAVYRSRDGGETWTPGKRLVPPSCPFSSLLIEADNTQTLYAANPCAGLFKSSDAGVTWSRADGGLDDAITLLKQSPHAPGLLLAASDTGQVYRSDDSSPESWELVSDGLTGELIQSLAISGPDTYWATTANGQASTLYRFSAGRWSAVLFDQPTGTETTNVFVDPDHPNILYVGLEKVDVSDTGQALLFRSTDGGVNWTPLKSEDTGLDAAVQVLGKAQRSDLLYVADGDELLSLSDGDDTWHPVELPRDLPAVGEVRQIAIDPRDHDVLYLPLRGGIAKSVDGGRNWRIVNTGLNNASVPLITSHLDEPATLYAASADGSNAFKSTNYGASWTRLGKSEPDFFEANELVLDPSHPDTIYQVTTEARIYRSDDGGTTWSVAWPEFRFSAIDALIPTPSDPAILYADRSGSGLFRSNDGGHTWRSLSQGRSAHAHALAVHPDDPFFVLSGEIRSSSEVSATLHKSKDGGETWEVSLALPDAAGITSVAFDPRVEPYFPRGKRPADPTRLYAASVGARGTLWFSDEAGGSWKPLNDDLSFTNVRILTVPLHRPGTAFAGVWGGGTWRTDDGGQSWNRLPGDPAASPSAIAVDPSNHNIVYIADDTTPHLYRSTDDGKTWEVIFDAEAEYGRLTALALAPSDPTILYVSALRTDGSGGSVFRIDANLPRDENATEIANDIPGTPTSLAVHRRDPRRLFAVLPGTGVWKTVDDGASWRHVQRGLPEADFSQIVVDPLTPETLFLAGSLDTSADPDEAYGIWKSTDDGNNWTRVGGATFGRASGPVHAIAFHPDDQRVMYAAGEGGVYLSPDRGETWTNISGRLPPFPMNAVASDGQALYAGSAGAGAFAGTIHPLIHTSDWTRESHLTIPVANIQIALHPDDPAILYASTFPGGIFETIDGGATWRERNSGLPSFAVADQFRQGHYTLSIAPSDPQVLYVGLYGRGVYRSDDGGTTWRPPNEDEGELWRANVVTLLVHSNDADVVYAATDAGIWRTVNGGRSWGAFSEGLPTGVGVRTLGLGADGQLYAGTSGYGLYVRSAFHQAGDDAWQQLPELGDWGDVPIDTSLLVHPGDSNTLYAGSHPAGIYKTTDGGLTWRAQDVGFEDDGVLSLALHPDEPQTLFVGTTDGVAYSTDGGATWHPRDIGWSTGHWVVSLAFDPTDPDVLYACSLNGLVMKSTDGGANWFEISTGLDLDQAFYQVLVDRFDPNTAYLATARDGVYISRDGGQTWSSWNEGLWNRAAGSGDQPGHVLQLSADGRLLYFGTDGSGVWRRPAAGAPVD